MKILVSGSSGLVGSALLSFCSEQHHEMHKLVRGSKHLQPHEIGWDPERGVVNPSQMEGFDAVIHLAGESIMGRWTNFKKKRIRDSRVKSTQLLCQTLCQLQNPPSVLIVASAVGFYGDCGQTILNEQSPKGEGFLADVCQEWEEATRIAAAKGIRVVNLRIGMVLSSIGGALKQMLPIFKMGLGGKMGSGNQVISWIAIDDLVRVIDFAIHEKKLAGPLNTVTPYPVTNEEMTKILGGILHRPTIFKVPTFMVNLVFGELGREVLLSSAHVEPKKLEVAGFHYKYPRMETALKALLS